MIDFGMVRPGTTLYIPFASYNASGASVTLTGLAVTDIEIYKDGGTTQRASDAGYTLLGTNGIDFDAVTGLHGFSVNLADNTTTADFWAAGSQYWVVVSAVTIDSQTVTFIAATFRIGYPAAILNTTIATLATQTSFTLTNGPAEDDALNNCEVIIHDVASAVQVGRAFIKDYTGATKTVTLAAGTTFTAAANDNISVMACHSGPLDRLLAYMQLSLRSDSAIATDRAAELTLINTNHGSGAGSYDNTVAPTAAIATTAISAPTGVPAATAGIPEMLARLYQALRNKVTVTGTKKIFYDDSDVALWEKDLSDDATTYAETKGNAP